MHLAASEPGAFPGSRESLRGASLKSARGFVGLVTLSISITAVLVAGGTGLVSLVLQYREMVSLSDQVESEYLASRRDLLEQEVNRAVSYIDHLRATGDVAQRDRLRDQVHVGLSAADGLYRHARTGGRSFGDDEVRGLVRAAAASVSTDLSNGAMIVLDPDGACVLCVGHPDLEGTNLSEVRSADGRLIIQEFLTLGRTLGTGYVEAHWSLPTKGTPLVLDSVYLQRWEPLNWVFIAAGNRKDMTEQLQSEALDYLRALHFGDGGYIFAAQWDGLSLCGPATGSNVYENTDNNGMKIVQELIRTAQEGGGFVEYVMPAYLDQPVSRKLSYVLPIVEWEWYVGSGCPIDDMEAAAAVRTGHLQGRLIIGMALTLCAAVLLALVGVQVARRSVRELAREVKVFGGWFGQARTDLIEINAAELHFEEFRQLAKDANAMVRTRQAAQARQRELEEALRQTQRLESLGVLAGGIAHGFNNLLAAILGHAELALLKLPEDSPVRDDLRDIRTAGERAGDLVRQILSFSRRASLEVRPVSLRALLDEAVRMLRATIPTTIEIRYDREGENPIVLADATQIHQIIVNLCTNAQHAMKEVGGVLELTLDIEELDAVQAERAGCPASGRYARLTVRDTGCGIDEETVSRVFEPFFTTKKPGEGTGLGLSFSHGVAQSHGGAMSVESILDLGTTFHVYLPVHDIAADIVEETPEAPAVGPSVRILLVDDDLGLLSAAQAMLEALGHTAEAYGTGADALEALARAPGDYDLLLTDQTMPGTTGVQVADAAKRIAPHIRVIIVTGYSAEIDQERAQARGIEGFLMKPFSMESLSAKITAVMWEQPADASAAD
jgi:signal transduction histidine kinase/ActR/RegA family two-component response regulator